MPLLSRRTPALAVLAILLGAALFRAWLIAENAFSFDSDEAVVGLMARHITHGKPVPTFYYGQAYMGSLDAILVAGGFAVLGESVITIRVVQLALYLIGLVTAYGLACTITGSRRVAAVALLLLAFPTALGTLYTGITLGGYNEIIILGNLVLLLSWQIAVQRRDQFWRWALLGLAAGVGWWVNGAIVTACLVAGFLFLWTSGWRRRDGVALVVLAFLAGSSPWWLYNLRHDWEALRFLTGGFAPPPGAEPVAPGEALAGLALLGLSALYGLRFPWDAGLVFSAGAVAGVAVYLALASDLVAGWVASLRGRGMARKDTAARRWVWGVFGVFTLVFAFSSFSDATGRYLMPLWVPAAIGVALGLERLRRAGWMVQAAALTVLIVAQTGPVIRAARTGTGLTPQLVERLRVPAAYDTVLLEFLAGEGITDGYAGYWTSYRLIFRSHEALILDTALPYDDKGYRPVTNRYPPYRVQVAAAPRVVWITQNFPALDAVIAARLARASVTYRTRDIGLYRVYYDFSTRVAPADFRLSSTRPLDEWRVP